MSVTSLLLPLLMLFQPPPAEDSTRAAQADLALPRGVTSSHLPFDELRARLAGGEYDAITGDQLQALLASMQVARADALVTTPKLRVAEYTVSFQGTTLQSGMVTFAADPDADGGSGGPVRLSATNLQRLQLSDSLGNIPLAADRSGGLFLMRSSLPAAITGTWSSVGLVSGDAVTFNLQLPAADTARVSVTTAADIEIISPGNLVLTEIPNPNATPSNTATAPTGPLVTWVIVPADSSRVTFTCRPLSKLSTKGTVLIPALSASHVLSGEVMNSRWTMTVPQELPPGCLLTLHLPPTARVSDVELDDARPVAWTATDDAGQRVLSLTLPDAAGLRTLTIAAATVCTEPDAFDIPILKPWSWQGLIADQHGSLVPPISQLTVRVPATVMLDEWLLIGIQERDVVSIADESREFQLTQFLPEASARARTSVSEPELTDSVVTLLEPAGRLATVRCFANVTCRQRAVVELAWPIGTGWQPISVRYASDSRALFFEVLPGAANGSASSSDPAAAPAQTLRLHLPEAIEPGASRVLEFQMQQLETLAQPPTTLPLGLSPQIPRAESLVVFPPALAILSDLQQVWSAGRRPLADADVRSRVPWMASSRLPSASLTWSVDPVFSDRQRPEIAATSTPSIVRRDHSVRLEQGRIVESFQIVVPDVVATNDELAVLIASDAAADLLWFLDGEPVAARMEAPVDAAAATLDGEPPGELPRPSSDPNWKRWTIPITSRRPGLPMVIRGEVLRESTRQLTASIAWPDVGAQVDGQLLLMSSDSGALSVVGLEPVSPAAASPATSDRTAFQLPGSPQRITIRVDAGSRIQGGQTIDVQMLHLIREVSGSLEQSVLALATVGRGSAPDVLPLSLPPGVQPFALVDGHRVRLRPSSNGLLVPLPDTDDGCQVLVTWQEPVPKTEEVTGERVLPRLFLDDLAVPQCTHHLLIHPELQLSASSGLYSAAEPFDALQAIQRRLRTADITSEVSVDEMVAKLPIEFRGFLTDWQLADASHWQHRTLIDSVTMAEPATILVTQTRRRQAIAVGAGLLLVALCIGLRNAIEQRRLLTALAIPLLLMLSLIVTSSVISAMLKGAFWGLCLGLVLVLVARRKPAPAIPPVAIIGLLLAVLTTLGPIAQAAPQSPIMSATAAQGPDVLTTDSIGDEREVVWVRKDLLSNWMSAAPQSTGDVVSAVVMTMHARIVAEATDSVELIVSLTCATPADRQPGALRIPLRGSRLVSCKVGAQDVLPETSGDELIVPLSPAILLPFVTLSDSSAAAAPAVQRTVDGFVLHEIECRLRPVVTRQPSRLQFRLPWIPAARSTAELVADASLIPSANASSASGSVAWIATDGRVDLDRLTPHPIDIQLLRKTPDAPAPAQARVETVAICEAAAGRQLLTCIHRIQNWNPLVTELRWLIPTGYRLLSISRGPSAASDASTDVYWQRQGPIAVIQLPVEPPAEFTLVTLLEAESPGQIEQQTIPIADLQQFRDCTPGEHIVLSVRANPVFSVLPVEAEHATTISFAEAQATWGQWLRRTDSVFRIPGGTATCLVRLAPRTSNNEVQIAQDARLRNTELVWESRLTIETSVLPVFRHEVVLSTDIELAEVTVMAGEANRLASWHRRGDRLLIQLKEATTGPHTMLLRGRRIIRPDDREIPLQSPRLQNAQVLESSLVIVDESGLGLSVARFGGTVPDERLEPGAVLPPGASIRLQVVRDEDPLADPLVLQRVHPLTPQGSIALLPDRDRVWMALHLTQWSGSQGPLRLKFSDDAAFAVQPVAFAGSQQFVLTQSGSEFAADADAVRSLFGQSELSVVWAIPVTEADQRERGVRCVIPEVTESVEWNRLTTLTNTASRAALDQGAVPPTVADVVTTIPDWLTEPLRAVSGPDLNDQRISAHDDAALEYVQTGAVVVPLAPPVTPGTSEPVQDVVAVARSFVQVRPGESPAGETTFLLFANRAPVQCSLRIPDGTVVTELESGAPARWNDTTRSRVIVALNSPVTLVRMRWLSRRADSSWPTIQVAVAPPFAERCECRSLLRMASLDQQPARLIGPHTPISGEDSGPMQSTDVAAGLDFARSNRSSVAVTTDSLPQLTSLIALLDESSRQFATQLATDQRDSGAFLDCRVTNGEAVQFSLRRRVPRSLLLSGFVCCSVIVLTLIARRGTGGGGEPDTVIEITPPDADAQSSTPGKTSLPEFTVGLGGAHSSAHFDGDRFSPPSLPDAPPRAADQLPAPLPETVVRAQSSVSDGSLPV